MIDLAFDLHREFVRIDIERHLREMIADEKSIVGRNRALVKNGKRRLELRRPAGQADQRSLLRIFHQRPLAVADGWRRALQRQQLRGTKPGRERRHSGALHHLSSVEHSASSETLLLLRSPRNWSNISAPATVKSIHLLSLGEPKVAMQ